MERSDLSSHSCDKPISTIQLFLLSLSLSLSPFGPPIASQSHTISTIEAVFVGKVVSGASTRAQSNNLTRLQLWRDNIDLRHHMCISRFLRARNRKLSEAEKMWQVSMQWRREFKVEALLEEFCAQSG
jgi:predicted ATPase